jgi:hypothetical protein
MFNVANIRTSEQIIAERDVSLFRSSRQRLIDESVVETTSQKKFDANELAQNRMSNALMALTIAGKSDSDTLHWSLADTASGVATEITVAELKEAYVRAVENMAAIWLR